MLRAGFAAIDITPDTRQSLIGYDFRWSELPPGNDGVHDPLLARAIVLEDGPTRAALVSLDLAVLEVDLARHLRKTIAARIGTSLDWVVVSTTHTHSGPFPRLSPPRRLRTRKTSDQRGIERHRLGYEYAQILQSRIEEAAARAAGLTYPVTASAIQAPLGIGYNRRVATKEGVKHCWNPLEFPQLTPAPSPDPTCTVLTLRQPAGPRRIVLWSAGAHPVVLGKTSRVVSADWPGAACRLLDESMDGCHSAFLLGPAGEVHPWIATQEDPAQIAPVAGAAGGLVRLLVESGAGSFEHEPMLAIANSTLQRGRHSIDLAAWRIGSARIVFAPVELFASLGAQLRREIGGPLIIATVSNGWTGYWPDKAAFGQGKYEVDATWGIKPGDGEALVEELARLARSV